MNEEHNQILKTPFDLKYFLEDNPKKFMLLCTYDGLLRKGRDWCVPETSSRIYWEWINIREGKMHFLIVENDDFILLKNNKGHPHKIKVSNIPLSSDVFGSVSFRMNNKDCRTSNIGRIVEVVKDGEKENDREQNYIQL